MNPTQRQILEHVAQLADRFECIAAIYIFGSVARGETATARDVDLAVEYDRRLIADDKSWDDLNRVSESFVQFQGCQKDWALNAGTVFGRPFHFARLYLTDRDDDAWRAIKATNPVAQLRKAIMVPTPRHEPKHAE